MDKMNIMTYNITHQYHLGAFIMPKELTQNSVQYFKTDKETPKSTLTTILKNVQEKIEEKNNLLLIMSENAQELERIESLVRLVHLRIKDLKDSEMEHLVEMAMPTVNLQQPNEILDQARQNAELRTDFLKTYKALGAEDVHKFCGSTATNKAALAGAWRTKGLIFKIENNNRQLYPVFQFDSTTGKPKPVIARILKALGANMGPWQIAIWFTTPNPSLQRCRPVDLLDRDPTRVVNAAKQLLADNLF